MESRGWFIMRALMTSAGVPMSAAARPATALAAVCVTCACASGHSCYLKASALMTLLATPLDCAITINVPAFYMARYLMVLRRTRSITRGIGRSWPWKSSLFRALKWLRAKRVPFGPKKSRWHNYTRWLYGGQNDPENKKTFNKYHLLKSWLFSKFLARILSAAVAQKFKGAVAPDWISLKVV